MVMRKNILLLAAVSVITLTNIEAKITDNEIVTITTQKQKEIKVEGAGKKQTIQAQSGDIIKIAGKDHEIVIHGSFAGLEIDGFNNKVTLQHVSHIEIEGASNNVHASSVDVVHIKGKTNHVHYQSSSNKNGKANVESQGFNNLVKKIN